jgi:acetyl-CoA carboxylase biotin carboxyl carrier protein
MGLKLSEIRRVLEAFNSSDWDEIHISDGETELHLVAAGVTPSRSTERPPAEAPTTPSTPAATGSVAAAAPAQRAELIDPAAIAVLTPSMGVFYRSPSPGAPPFVEVGDIVEAGTTMCIVEVMKLMNPIQAGVAGTVIGIHVTNAGRVTSGQTLFTVAPAG